MISHAPVDYVCPFCRNLSGAESEFPLEVTHRDREVFVKMNPKSWENNPGSVLVISTEHYESIFDLPSRLGAPLQRAARAAAFALKAALQRDGVSTRQHNEPAGNQDVWHYHLHVFPRWHGDDLYGSRATFAAADELRDRANALREVWPAAWARSL